MGSWPEFLNTHGEVLRRSSRYELLFAQTVLARVRGLDPASVKVQRPFTDDDGRPRRIDFAIAEPPHVRIAIEVVG